MFRGIRSSDRDAARTSGYRNTFGEESLFPSHEPLESSRKSSISTSRTSLSGSTIGPASLAIRTLTLDDSSSDPHGLNLVTSPSEVFADVIFIHGIGGTSVRSWSWKRDPRNFWPAWLEEDPETANLRVFTYGYDASFLGSNSHRSLLDFAADLVARMNNFGSRESGQDPPLGDRPIIFIAHSMGGLVVKKAYILGRNSDGQERRVFAKVHGIIFLSTPHGGSSDAPLLKNVLSFMAGSKIHIQELEKGGFAINDMNEQFKRICGTLQLASFYESLPTRITGVRKMMVGKDTGVLGYTQELCSALHADHHGVCKFSSRLDQNYILVLGVLRRMVQDLSIATASPQQPSDDLTIEKQVRSILGIKETPQDDLYQAISQSGLESCQWFHKRDSFQKWLTDSVSTNRFLWLTGVPGTGKSTLAGVTIRKIQELNPQGGCHYHFFIESQPMKRNISYSLRSIALQIALSNVEFAEKLIQWHRKSGLSIESQSYRAIWDKIYNDIIFKMDFGYPLYWVIDGVDEAETPAALVKLFMQMESKSPIKVLLLSRPARELTNLTTPRADAVRHESISKEDTLEDIKAYVERMVQEILPDNKRVQKTVITQVLEKSEGSFLWTKLALETLRQNWHTQGDIITTLNNVPKDMESLYRKMLELVEAQGPRPQERAFKILTWAACSFRPLKVTELEEALAPEYGEFLSLADTIVQICGHFVGVNNDNVSLIHATARRFLIHPSDGKNPIIDPHAAHEHLASVCIRYLSLDRWRRVLAQVPEDNTVTKSDRLQALYKTYPFLQYAKDHWAYHVSRAPVNSPNLLSLLKFFFQKRVLSWIQAVALSSNLRTLTHTAQLVKTYLRRKKWKASLYPPTSLVAEHSESEAEFLDRWVIDLIRVVGKFSSILIQSPLTVHRHIPPLCPPDSAIGQNYGNLDDALLTVSGVSASGWDDNLARLSVGRDENASKIICAGPYFAGLISTNGTIVVWHAETFEELRRLRHKEWVLVFERNRAGTLIVSGGECSIKIWDIRTGEQLHTLEIDPEISLMCLAFGNTNDEIIVGYENCAVVRYDLKNSAEIDRFYAEEEDDDYHSCPRFMSISPDLTKLALAYRGRPVLLWDLVAWDKRHPQRCICTEDRDRWDGMDEEVWNATEAVQWHPDGSSLYILYHDTTLLDWRLMEDQQFEHRDTGAREIAINHDGTLLLGSHYNGTLSVWTIPKLGLIYRLSYEGLVHDLCFSPDSQRIYDLRDLTCNVWEPDVLVRPDDLDQDDRSNSFDGSFVSDAVYSQHKDYRSQVTALLCDGEDQFFCCGRDNGTVYLHDMRNGKKIKKLCTHAPIADIIVLGWSPSRRYVASADDLGRIMLKRLRIKDDGRWAVYAIFDLHLDDAVEQFVFNADENLLLISTTSSDHIWSIKEKRELCQARYKSTHSRKWVNHPQEKEYLLWVDTNNVHTYRWADLQRLSVSAPFLEAEVPTQDDEDDDDQASISSDSSFGDSSDYSPSSPHRQQAVRTVLLARDKRHIICETTDAIHGARTELITSSDISESNTEPPRRTILDSEFQLQRLLGLYKDRLVFLDHQNWICAADIAKPQNVARRFFLPRDWLCSTDSVNLITLDRNGAILCPKNGEVAIVRYAHRL